MPHIGRKPLKYIMSGFIVVLITQKFSDVNIKKNEKDGACGTYAGQKKCIHSFGGKTQGRDHLEDLGVNGNMVLKFMFIKQNGNISVRKESISGLLRKRYRPFGFYKTEH
jgi:hypothetical protein